MANQRFMRALPKPGLKFDDSTMGLLDHLNELRQRFTKILIAVVIGTIFGVLIAQPVLEFLQLPYGRAFTVLGPTGGVVVYFRVALMVGAMVSIPIITYQVMMFVLPGLTSKERRYVLTALPAIVLLFVIGVVFAWGILIPPALGFLENFQPTLFKPEWTGELYLSFVTTLLFWMGVAFESPMIFLVLSLLGAVNARQLIKSWRIAIIGSSIAAALITPTVDPVNMGLVMGPLLALYVLSIGLVAVGGRFARKRLADVIEPVS